MATERYNPRDAEPRWQTKWNDENVFLTKNDVLLMQGEAVLGLEAAARGLVQPGTEALNLVQGVFGKGMGYWLKDFGAELRELEVPYNDAVDPADVERDLDEHPGIELVTVVHSETPSGTVCDVSAIGPIARSRGALTLIDCVSSLGGIELRTDEWQLDVCVAGAQKCLGAPSGLAPIAFAPSALARLVACRSFYFDIALLEDYWAARKYHHTICSPLVFAFHEALVAIEEEGLEARWARHAAVHQAFARGIGHLGLSFLVPESERLMTLNTVRIPDGVNDAAVRTALRDRFSIEIGAGMGPLAGKVWRIGLMGASAGEAHVVTLVGALRSAIPH